MAEERGTATPAVKAKHPASSRPCPSYYALGSPRWATLYTCPWSAEAWAKAYPTTCTGREQKDNPARTPHYEPLAPNLHRLLPAHGVELKRKSYPTATQSLGAVKIARLTRPHSLPRSGTGVAVERETPYLWPACSKLYYYYIAWARDETALPTPNLAPKEVDCRCGRT